MVNLNKAGLVGGALLGGWHLVWSLLVLSGFAQVVYDFVLWAHMINLELTVGPFDATAAATLVAFTAVVGYVMGFIAAWVWNRVRRS